MANIPSGIIIPWVTASSIPSGWSRETTLDNRFGKSTTGSPVPNSTGGSATHVHTSATHLHGQGHNHTGTSAASAAQLGNTSWGYAHNIGMNAHTHTYTIGTSSGNSNNQDAGSWSSSNSNPAMYTVRWIKSDGSPTGFPNTSVAFYNSGTPPTGWIQHVGSKNYFLIGADTGANGGATTAGAAHTHTTSAHTHVSGNHTHPSAGASTHSSNTAVDACTCIWSATIPRGSPGHTHTTNAFASSGSVTSGALSGGTSAGSTYEPSYVKLLGIENNSGAASLEEGIIVGWLGTIGAIPDEWVLCDGNNDTRNLNGKFIKAANLTSEVGDTGGTLGHQNSSGGHTHTAAHTHPGGATSSNAAPYTFPGVGAPLGSAIHDNTSGNPHAHGNATSASGGALASTSPTLADTGDTQPAFRTLAWLEYQPVAGGNISMFGSNF